MNKAIYKQPLILFLGAGASAPLGKKTTVEFLKWLLVQMPTMAELILAAERYIQPSEEVGGLDVEAVLDFLDGVVRAGRLLDKLGGDERLVSTFKRSVLTDIVKVSEYEKLFNEIKDLVVEHYSEVDGEKAFDLYRPLLELATSQPLPVFTTNYDLALEKAYESTSTPSYDLSSAPFSLIDGFTRQRVVTPTWSRSVYDDYEPTGADVILFKLHGSVDWVRTPSGVIQRVESQKRDPGGMTTEIAYPSRLKMEIHEEPYRTNYDYLLACLLHAKVCAVIGFSFRDQEIVEELRQAIQLNKKLRLLIIDPKSVLSQLHSKLGFAHRFTTALVMEFSADVAHNIPSIINREARKAKA